MHTVIKRALCGFLVLALGSAWAKGESPEHSPHYTAIEEIMQQCDEDAKYARSLPLLGLGVTIAGLVALVTGKKTPSLIAGTILSSAGFAFSIISAAVYSCGKKFQAHIMDDTIVFWNEEENQAIKCLVEYGPGFYFNEKPIAMRSTENFEQLNLAIDIQYSTCQTIENFRKFELP